MLHEISLILILSRAIPAILSQQRYFTAAPLSFGVDASLSSPTPHVTHAVRLPQPPQLVSYPPAIITAA
jgi:hypothetical protein